MALQYFDGWIVYASSAAGFLFLCLVAANTWKAYESYRERKAVERIEQYLYKRFGDAQ